MKNYTCSNLLFFTTATGIYKDFIIPYVYFAYMHNKGAAFEFLVDDPSDFFKNNLDAYQYLIDLGCEINIRKIPIITPRPRMDNSIRFLVEPELYREYVYIGDIDILITENILDKHYHVFDKGLAYSNIVRDGTKRLTGLHFCKYSSQYPLPKVDDLITQFPNDEELLYAIMERKRLIFSDDEYKNFIRIRPIHGIHMSVNRMPYFWHHSRVSWGIEYSDIIAFDKIFNSAVFQDFLQVASASTRLILCNLIFLSRGILTLSEEAYYKLTSHSSTNQKLNLRKLNASTGYEKLFIDYILINERSGMDSLSGASSSPSRTKNIQYELPELIKRRQINTISDLGCGDMCWMKFVLEKSKQIRYFGLDIVKELIVKNQEKHGNYDTSFYQKDIRNDKLPRCDLVICRDVLSHFSEKDIFAFLQNFLDSGSTYLLTTTHKNNNSFTNQDIETGKWRYLDLLQQPYNFPEPLEKLDDGGGDRYLCLWSRDQIANIVKMELRC